MKFFVIAAACAVFAANAQAQSVQGPWAEVRGGWDHATDSVGSANGFLYGAAAGYDFAVGTKTFLGLQAGIAGSTTEVCDLGICSKAGRDIEALARAGFSIADRTALYGLAGYTNARVNVSGAGFSDGVNVDGFRLGAGVEQQFGSKTYTKLEYRYSNYGEARFAGVNLGDAGDRHQISASFGVRF